MCVCRSVAFSTFTLLPNHPHHPPGAGLFPPYRTESLPPIQQSLPRPPSPAPANHPLPSVPRHLTAPPQRRRRNVLTIHPSALSTVSERPFFLRCNHSPWMAAPGLSFCPPAMPPCCFRLLWMLLLRGAVPVPLSYFQVFAERAKGTCWIIGHIRF